MTEQTLDIDPPQDTRKLEQGTRVERYVILKSVGEGGMGVVYAAYDPELDRKVALKLLRPDNGGADSSEGRARLLREAQAMARITHPNVIAVHDVGTFSSHVFITMEFIQGRNLRDWIHKEQHPWQEVLEVFLEAGRGLVAAHRAGLVHRDFKPANVLVSDDGRVCVMDFGLARLAEASQREEAVASGEDLLGERSGVGLSTELTAAGVILGTPQYMPPEQYVANLGDARLDQFSFCASLYWALYGQRPFEPKRITELALEARKGLQGSQDLQEFGRKLPQGSAAEEPPRDSRVPTWVRRTVLRGLSLNPDHRFPSMAALLEALSQQHRRARLRWGVAAAAAALAVLGGGLYVRHQSQVCRGAEPLMASVWSPTARQKLEASFTATGTPFAEQSSRRVVELLGAYASGWSRMHTEACEATRVRGEQTEELLSLRMVCLERRRKNLGALVGLLAEADAKVVERSVDAAAALPSLEPCRDIASLNEQAPLPADPDRRATIEQLGAEIARIKALHDAGRYKVALELARTIEPQVLAISYLPLRAELRHYLGWLLQQTGDGDEGIRQLKLAFADAESSHADRTRLEVLTKLIYALANNGHPEQSQSWAQVALAILNRLGGEPTLAIDLMGNLGSISLVQGRYQEATDYFEKARALQRDTSRPDDPKRAKVSYGLGLAALRQGEHARAIQMLTEALVQTEALKGSQHPETGARHVMLATAYRESGVPVQALSHAEAALRVREATLGPDHPAVADALDEQGECLLALKRYEDAGKAFSKALDIKSEKLGKDHPDLSYSYDGLGKVALEQGRFAEAVTALRQAVSYEDAEPEALAESGFLLAQALWGAGKEFSAARAEALRARERYEKLGKPKQVAEIDAWLQAR
jgi:tetratricopeptide (TPR) repeat protein/predicted Ser/Thr protein kinase